MKQPHCAQKTASNWISTGAALLALVTSIALAGCGGGGAGDPTSTSTSSTGGDVASAGGAGAEGGATQAVDETTPPNLAKVSLPQALFELSYSQVINTSYLSVASANATKATAAAASPSPTITPTELLNWAEATFPARFPAGAEEQTSGALTYRYYATTDVYLGVANNSIYAFGSDTASKIVVAGNLGDFNCSVKPSSCVVTPVQAFTCDAAAITCLEVVSTADTTQSSVPVTFGQPFKTGDWKHKETGLIARDNFNQAVPLQADEISSHKDGSARFAVLSAQLSGMQAKERRIINIFRSGNLASASSPILPSSPDWNLVLEAKLYNQQTTLLSFGNYVGYTEGIPFLEGEQITLRLTGPASEDFTLKVTKELAGGGYLTLAKIAEAFMSLINTQSKSYAGSKTSGYEKLWITTKDPAAGAFKVQFIYSGQAVLTQENLSTFQTPQLLIAKPQAQLEQKIALQGKRRLNGSVAQEFTIVTPFKDSIANIEHPQLTARLHTRIYENGKKIRTEAVIENNWAYKAAPGNITYEMAFKKGAQTIYQQPIFTHYHHARWRKIIWTGVEPNIQVRQHMPYFLASRAVLNYNLNLQVPESVLASEASKLAAADTRPMGPAFISQYFPTTGGRWDIGPLPRWTVLYLVTQDERARASMLANAEAASGIPIHYRDEITDHPLDLDRHPGVTTRFGNSDANDALPVVSNGATPWTVDTAHQGSFAYVPYLITGDKFFQDEVMFWASWNMTAVNPGYREYSRGLIKSEQVRGQAWGLRSIGEAAFALPDSHELKSYFQTRLNNNLTYYVDKYPRNTVPGDVSPMGSIEKPDEFGRSGPWQNDLMSLVVSQIAEQGEPLAQEFLMWISKFNVGRFQNENNGFCMAKAPAYYINIRDSNGAFINDWRQLFQENWPGVECSNIAPISPTDPAGYEAYARAMLAAAHNAKIPGALEAYTTWSTMTQSINNAQRNDPTWTIVPR